MSKILKWVQEETNTEQTEKLCVEDYSQINTMIQYFESIFRNPEQILDAEIEKRFTGFFTYLRYTADIKLNENEIERLQNLITILVKEIGRDSLFYRKILLQISLRNTTGINVKEKLQSVE